MSYNINNKIESLSVANTSLIDDPEISTVNNKLSIRRKKELKAKVILYSPYVLSFILFVLLIKKYIEYNKLFIKYDRINQKFFTFLFAPFTSDTITTMDDFRILKAWLKPSLTNNDNTEVSWRMLYKSTLHGDESKKFHELLDGKTNWLVIIKDSEDHVFGGYSSYGFKPEKFVDFTNGINIEDADAFWFSLTDNRKYPILDQFKHNAIYADDELGPTFGNGDLFIVNKWHSNESTAKKFSCYKGNGGIENVRNGNVMFTIKEMEVFKALISPL